MKVNEKIISIPPFISTHWNNVNAIHMKGSVLLVTLIDGDTISIPNLSGEVVEAIFQYHAQHLEQAVAATAHFESQGSVEKGVVEQIMEIPFRIGIGTIDGLSSSIMQHTSQHGEMPNLPNEFLDKICEIIKTIAGDDAVQQMKAEPHCNCPHCQVSRSLAEETSPNGQGETVDPDSEVHDEELQFCEWDIEQKGENLFSVTHRIDKTTYNVFLGEPIGCTCGKEDCEHIEAVLKAPLEPS